jgi:hypothetical protein
MSLSKLTPIDFVKFSLISKMGQIRVHTHNKYYLSVLQTFFCPILKLTPIDFVKFSLISKMGQIRVHTHNKYYLSVLQTFFCPILKINENAPKLKVVIFSNHLCLFVSLQIASFSVIIYVFLCLYGVFIIKLN